MVIEYQQRLLARGTTMPKARKKYYEAIPVGQLKVDTNLDAQRMFQPKWAKKLESIWDPEVLLPHDRLAPRGR